MDNSGLITRLRAYRKEISPDQPVEVGMFRPDDALGVSLLYYEIYGDAFPITHVYDPQEVLRRNRTNTQHTVVARTAAGEIVGLGGMFNNAPNPGVFESAQLMVHKSYRKTHVSTEIVKRLLVDLPGQMAMPAVFVEAVCNHTASQDLAARYGLHCTGLELECMPIAAYAKEGAGRHNVSLLVMFKIFKDSPHTVYLPDAYSPIITTLYKELNLERRQKRQEIEGAEEETLMEKFLLPETGFGRLTLTRIGKDLNQLLYLFEECIGETPLAQIYVNLGDRSAPWAVETLQERGYFFSGLLPLWFSNQTDGLVMQKTARPPEWEAIRLIHESAQRICEAVRKDYDRTST